MTTIEKNIAIAEMLGWKQDASNNGSSDDFLEKKGYKFIYSEDLKYHSDANWQYEAIDWIEKIKLPYKGYAYLQMVKNNIWIYVYQNNTNKCVASFSGVDFPQATKKEAVFEALYQFSQYLKQKK